MANRTPEQTVLSLLEDRDWSNANNHPMNDEKALVQWLEDRIAAVGLKGDPDIHCLIHELNFNWRNASILDIGAGTGRGMARLLWYSCDGPIFGLERVRHYLERLERRFATINNVRIIDADILSTDLRTLRTDMGVSQVDLILWLSAGIGDFNPEEQLTVLEKLAGLTGRMLVVETPATGEETTGTVQVGDKHVLLNEDNTTWDYAGWILNPREIHRLAYNAGLQGRKRIKYQTNTGKRRFLYFLERQCFRVFNQQLK